MRTIQYVKIQRLVGYSYHICSEIGYKIIDCPIYNDMQICLRMKERSQQKNKLW
jgi:hypothetical protein